MGTDKVASNRICSTRFVGRGVGLQRLGTKRMCRSTLFVTTILNLARRMRKSALVLQYRFSGLPGESMPLLSVNLPGRLRLTHRPRPDSHHGPAIDYLAPCSGECLTVNPLALRFTKIAESGIVKPGSPNSYKWATDEIHQNNNTHPVKIPSSLKAGNYVLRTELIALHTAGTVGGAQNYPQCFNLKVTGSGTTSLPAGMPATQFYKPESKGIVFNIAARVDSYPVPGPPLWKGGAS